MFGYDVWCKSRVSGGKHRTHNHLVSQTTGFTMNTTILSTVGSFLFELFNGTSRQHTSELCKGDTLLFGDGFLA
jgi:hypothetical protein